MAINFNTRVFGADIHPILKNKLLARQALAQSDTQPNEPIQFQKLPGTDNIPDINEATGVVNFTDKNVLV